MHHIPLTAPTPPPPPAAVWVVRHSAFLAHVTIGGLLVTFGVLALTSIAELQRREAATSAWVLDNLLHRPAWVLPSSPTVLFQKRPGDDASWAGLVVTADCSAAYFVGGTLLAAGLLALLWRRARLRRLFTAAVDTALLLLLVNTVHIVVVAEAASRWGAAGSEWTHSAVGPALMIATLCISGTVFARAQAGGRHR